MVLPVGKLVLIILVKCIERARHSSTNEMMVFYTCKWDECWQQSRSQSLFLKKLMAVTI